VFIVDGGVGGRDMRRGTYCMHSWGRGGDDRELFKLLKSGQSQPKDKGLGVGTEGQEYRGREMSEGTHCTLGVGDGFFYTH